MSALSFALIFALTTVLLAEFVNGWTDAPNVIAVVVSTGVMSPKTAILMAVLMNMTARCRARRWRQRSVKASSTPRP